MLVLHDMLGVNLGKMPKFVRNFMLEASSIRGATAAYVAAVKDGSFPVNALHPWSDQGITAPSQQLAHPVYSP